VSFATRLLFANPGAQVSSALSGALTTPGAKGAASPDIASAYDALATIIAPSGGLSTVSFTGIPQTGYSHLQLRVFARNNTGGGTAHDTAQIRMNNDSGSNYNHHVFYGSSSVGSYAWGAGTGGYAWEVAQSASRANTFAINIIDIIDYAATNKAKVWRSLTGLDMNDTGGNFSFISGVWLNNSAINRIDFILPQTAAENTQFALYGVK
jgi:hypothetical protein